MKKPMIFCYNDILERSVKILRAALAPERQVKYDTWAVGKSVVEQYRKLSADAILREEKK